MSFHDATTSFTTSLTAAQRNHLRLLLSRESSLKNLRQALGIKTIVTVELESTGAARAGRTADLDWPEDIRRHLKRTAADIVAIDRH